MLALLHFQEYNDKTGIIWDTSKISKGETWNISGLQGCRVVCRSSVITAGKFVVYMDNGRFRNRSTHNELLESYKFR